MNTGSSIPHNFSIFCFPPLFFHAVLIPCFLRICDPFGGLRSSEGTQRCWAKATTKWAEVCELDLSIVSAQSVLVDQYRPSVRVSDDFCFKILQVGFEVLAKEE